MRRCPSRFWINLQIDAQLRLSENRCRPCRRIERGSRRASRGDRFGSGESEGPDLQERTPSRANDALQEEIDWQCYRMYRVDEEELDWETYRVCGLIHRRRRDSEILSDELTGSLPKTTSSTWDSDSVPSFHTGRWRERYRRDLRSIPALGIIEDPVYKRLIETAGSWKGARDYNGGMAVEALRDLAPRPTGKFLRLRRPHERRGQPHRELPVSLFSVGQAGRHCPAGHRTSSRSVSSTATTPRSTCRGLWPSWSRPRACRCCRSSVTSPRASASARSGKRPGRSSGKRTRSTPARSWPRTIPTTCPSGMRTHSRRSRLAPSPCRPSTPAPTS